VSINIDPLSVLTLSGSESHPFSIFVVVDDFASHNTLFAFINNNYFWFGELQNL
jgi:hypothetical protein